MISRMRLSFSFLIAVFLAGGVSPLAQGQIMASLDKEVFNISGEVVGNNLYEWLLEFLQHHDVDFQLINRNTEGKD